MENKLELLYLLNLAARKKETPMDWRTGIVVPRYKKEIVAYAETLGGEY